MREKKKNVQKMSVFVRFFEQQISTFFYPGNGLNRAHK